MPPHQLNTGLVVPSHKIKFLSVSSTNGLTTMGEFQHYFLTIQYYVMCLIYTLLIRAARTDILLLLRLQRTPVPALRNEDRRMPLCLRRALHLHKKHAADLPMHVQGRELQPPNVSFPPRRRNGRAWDDSARRLGPGLIARLRAQLYAVCFYMFYVYCDKNKLPK